jgi:hypothetical protein
MDCDCIPRERMPQIDEADLLSFVDFAIKRGFVMRRGFIDPRRVRGRQKVRSIPDALLSKPVLISSEPMTLDGNHRWMRHVLAKTEMPFIQVCADFSSALILMFAFPKTYSYGDGNFHPIRN